MSGTAGAENGYGRQEGPSMSKGHMSMPSSSKRVAEDGMERRNLDKEKHTPI